MTLLSNDCEDSSDSAPPSDDTEDSSDIALCGVVYIVLSLSGSPTLSVMSHARGREFREFKEYREVRAKANKAKRPKRQGAMPFKS